MSSSLVVGVDSSLTATGLCELSDDLEVVLSTVGTKAGPGARHKLGRMRYLADDIAQRCVLSNVVMFEGPSFASKGSATRDLAGLWWLVLDRLDELKVTVGVVPPSVLKKWTTGKGTASKFQVGQHIAKRWPHEPPLNSDNEGDALALASMGLQRLGLLPWTPTKVQTAQLGEVEWL